MNNSVLLILSLTSAVAFGEEANFMQTSDGLVVIEAEHFQTNTPQGAHAWVSQPDEKASGKSVVLSQPADKAQLNKPEEFTANSPRLDYKVTFLMPGRHFLWVKAKGAFVHLGLDGTPIINSQRIGGFPGNDLDWRNQCRATYGQPAFLDVAAAGEHTVNLWMQSPGTAVDKIVLSPLADFKPSSDTDLVESPRGKLPPQPPRVTLETGKEINPPIATVKLAGEAKDYDGQVTGYVWTQVDGPAKAVFSSAEAAATEVSQLTDLGVYRFRFTAKDDSGLSAYRDMAVKVTPAVPPTVQVPAEKVLISDKEIEIYPTASDADSDPKVHPLTFAWEQVSGPSKANVKVQNISQAVITGLVEGTYVFKVSVTDFTGNTSSAETKVIKRAEPPNTAISASDPAIQYTGRFYTDEKKPDVRESGWPVTAIRARFEGTSIRARLVLAGWGAATTFYAVIDGKEDAPVVLGGDKRGDWLVAEGLPDGEHTIELIRLSGAWCATSSFSGFYLDAGKKLLEPPPRPTRRIEFYGDSITEGSMMSDQPFSNAYLAYAATTARLLKAETSVISKSGIGLVKGFTLPQTLPGMVDRTVPLRGDQKWDFTQWIPHVVVINIGQNDSWTGADPVVFKETYIAFIKTIRGFYPKAHIVCALGSMDAVAPNSKWPTIISEIVTAYRSESKDERIDPFFFEFLGAKGHPNSIQAKAMAEKLSAFIEAKGPSLWLDSDLPKQ